LIIDDLESIWRLKGFLMLDLMKIQDSKLQQTNREGCWGLFKLLCSDSWFDVDNFVENNELWPKHIKFISRQQNKVEWSQELSLSWLKTEKDISLRITHLMGSLLMKTSSFWSSLYPLISPISITISDEARSFGFFGTFKDFTARLELEIGLFFIMEALI